MVIVAAFYRFAPLLDPVGAQHPLAQLACSLGVKGTVLLAPEGVNATIAGDPAAVDRVLAHIRGWPGFEAMEHKAARADAIPFRRLKVRVKREIVTLRAPADPTARVGTYVAPQDWNALIAQPDVAVIDCRNGFEIALGTFPGAIDPETASFSDFPAWWQANAHRFRGQRVAMFCTGGIRCEKATSWLLDQGLPEVFHLQGGILKYLETVPPTDSRWQGACFVFDERETVGAAPQSAPQAGIGGKTSGGIGQT
jgi:UPF0176 protein